MKAFYLFCVLSVTLSGPSDLGAQQPGPTPSTESAPVAPARSQGLAGYWQGALRVTPAVNLRLALEVSANGTGSLSGNLLSLDQGAARLPLTAVAERGGVVHLEVSKIGGSFDGTLSADGSELAGEWKQGGAALPLTFSRRATAPTLTRPQDPVRPYPYVEQEVTFQNTAAGIRLAATLTRPNGAGPYPAVVLITGSGPQDRDESLMGHRPFLVLADFLTRQGIAVLRYDDRGIGRSTGNFLAAVQQDFVSDALAAVAWLKTQTPIDPSRIGLAGHSEGGLIAPLAAVKQPGDIAFIVLLAGPGVPMEAVLSRQADDIARAMGAPPDLIAQAAADRKAVFNLVRQPLDRADLEMRLRALIQEQLANLTEEQRKAAGYSDAAMNSQLQLLLMPWFRGLLTYDPRPTLRQVKSPVLAINGGKDLQVAAEPNLAGIREALAAGGNRDVTVTELPGLNHLFQTASTGTVSEYGSIEETFSPLALETISAWIRRRTRLD